MMWERKQVIVVGVAAAAAAAAVAVAVAVVARRWREARGVEAGGREQRRAHDHQQEQEQEQEPQRGVEERVVVEAPDHAADGGDALVLESGAVHRREELRLCFGDREVVQEMEIFEGDGLRDEDDEEEDEEGEEGEDNRRVGQTGTAQRPRRLEDILLARLHADP
ncbi:hypothetical protein PTSG_06140 [Salpingoeca rosetta]|uniref:Uncharacterized protein n=1 Tax=Salpingoeca rosetta (strain ATCC 50818 / BSB-021) TaxID=946362 RepID=F2UC23_SALR5|nr:uncharacterized protein PTSG_06140 [Salpingoeca rosetta]EGD74130.1 hypothetical protein PTSG_06140 [Salpingoeca rosetta]|eukprot:XP_004993031.1 hypothetical protein PTSG_06140 [Salpingoeca rosetta]